MRVQVREARGPCSKECSNVFAPFDFRVCLLHRDPLAGPLILFRPVLLLSIWRKLYLVRNVCRPGHKVGMCGIVARAMFVRFVVVDRELLFCCTRHRWALCCFISDKSSYSRSVRHNALCSCLTQPTFLPKLSNCGLSATFAFLHATFWQHKLARVLA